MHPVITINQTKVHVKIKIKISENRSNKTDHLGMKTADKVTSNKCAIEKHCLKLQQHWSLNASVISNRPVALSIVIFPQCKKHHAITIKHTRVLK